LLVAAGCSQTGNFGIAEAVLNRRGPEPAYVLELFVQPHGLLADPANGLFGV
jgi:hypothetical protein